MLHSALDDCFPEPKQLFYAMNTKGLWAALENCPFPGDVQKFTKTALADIVAKASWRKTDGVRKAAVPYLAAETSIGLKRIGDAVRYRLTVCLSELKRTILKRSRKKRRSYPFVEKLDNLLEEEESWITKQKARAYILPS